MDRCLVTKCYYIFYHQGVKFTGLNPITIQFKNKTKPNKTKRKKKDFQIYIAKNLALKETPGTAKTNTQLDL